MFDTFNLWTLYAVLALDVISTLYALGQGAHEGNPLLSWAARISPLAFQLLLIGSHCLIAYALTQAAGRIGPHVLWVVSAVFAGAVLNNLYVIFRAHRAST